MVPLIKKNILFLIILTATTACQIGYIAKSAMDQARIMRKREPINKVLKQKDLQPDIKKKLLLTKKVRRFVTEVLGLKITKNYTTYVQLDSPYVTYVVSAAKKEKLSMHTWNFPIIGSVPYRGYFKKSDAEEFERSLKKKNLDTYLRGVSAFSTLGWFNDPLLSSMMKYSEPNLVSTIIHESVHANLYIANNSKFNERIATYLGDLGTEIFYKDNPQVLSKIKTYREDQLTFSIFLSKQLKKLENHYNEKTVTLENRKKYFDNMQRDFTKSVLPKMKTKSFNFFAEKELNNAYLLHLRLYMEDFKDFEKLGKKHQEDFQKVFKKLKSLETSKDPEIDLKKLSI